MFIKQILAAAASVHAASESCPTQTVGTCRWLACDKNRGPTDCTNNKCFCKPGYCTWDGKKCLESECSAGHYGPGCQQCIGGATRRRRASSCTECDIGYYDAGDKDDCTECAHGSTRRRRATSCSECGVGYRTSGRSDDCTAVTCPVNSVKNEHEGICICRIGHAGRITWGGASAPNQYAGACLPCNGVNEYAAEVGLAKCQKCPRGHFAVPVGNHPHTGCDDDMCEFPLNIPAHAHVVNKHCPMNGTMANLTAKPAPASLCQLACDADYMEEVGTTRPYTCQADSEMTAAYHNGYIKCTPAPCEKSFCASGRLTGDMVSGCHCSCLPGTSGKQCEIQHPCPLDSVKDEQGICGCQVGHAGSIQWDDISGRYLGICLPCKTVNEYAAEVGLEKCKSCPAGHFAVPAGNFPHTGCDDDVCEFPLNVPAHAHIVKGHCPTNGTMANLTAPASLCHLACDEAYVEKAGTTRPHTCQADSAVTAAYQNGYINCTPAPCSEDFCTSGIVTGNMASGCSCVCPPGTSGRHCDVLDVCAGMRCADGSTCQKVQQFESYTGRCVADATGSTWMATLLYFVAGAGATCVATPLLVACHVRKAGSCVLWGIEVRALTRLGRYVEELMPLKSDYRAPNLELGEAAEAVGCVAEERTVPSMASITRF